MNKYKLLIIICFLFLTNLLPTAKAWVNNYTLAGKIICLDSGHGGTDSGAEAETILEKDLNLKLAKKLEKELISRGATVYMTRNGDYDLSTTTVNRKRSDLYNRASYINKINPDMYISIHLNATPSKKWRGLQIFYTNKNNQNRLIAETLTDYLKGELSYVRDVKKDNSYYMYKHINSPGILIEAGFISNPNDNYLLRNNNYQNKLILLISEGIEKYFKK